MIQINPLGTGARCEALDGVIGNRRDVLAPHDTNVEKQAKRHGPAMIAIAGSVAVALLLFLGYFLIATDTEDTPAESVVVPSE